MEKVPKELALNVLKVSQPIGDFFIASMPAKDLVEISYRDVRRLAQERRDVEKYLGIQRPVSDRRIKQIKKYIEGSDATFPTSVILAVDGKCAEYDSESSVLTLKPYLPEVDVDEDGIPFDRIAKVIDGQHRIAAFMDENENWEFQFDERSFDINVSIFIGADISEQANIFATVNLAQTKVNKSLVYDLTELAKARSPHKTCHDVAVVLDDEKSSPFYKRIKRLGTATPGRGKEPLTQASFVEALVKFISIDPVLDRNLLLEGKRLSLADWEWSKTPFRKMFIEGRDLDIAEIIYNYFSSVREKWPTAWKETDRVGNLLPRSNAFKALMKFLYSDVYCDAAARFGDIPTIENFSRYFEPLDFEDSAFTTRRFSPGSGGQATFLKMLRGEVKMSDMLED
ncbi:DGQHR domain-containing protein [Microbulbifer sp. CAU 1566]|uniref:DGQHR domain-containing protein n=1 Tax=Microbulbifer sp. CAU 1566 TaxID=2933269 RepID=UPI002004D68B|nr:DGQHR domain-containing protein [Microbulbifer sp. CAU 1566]MCK7598471.1 DGQHR domain-containing protein [Microbulbifer sp. CAU 1566]